MHLPEATNCANERSLVGVHDANMLLECGILHGGVGTLRTAEPHRRGGGVRAQHVRPQLEVGDAREVALLALEVLLEVYAVHPLPVHIGHVLYEAASERRRKITEHTLKI